MPHTKSPLRYPGGKTQLLPFVKNIIELNNSKIYIEPFAGGAGLAIELLLSNTVEKIIINDLDPSIYAFWDSVINKSVQLIKLIENVPFDYIDKQAKPSNLYIEFWQKMKATHEREKTNPTSLMNAFSTLMLNRMNVSGIISGGPIGGSKQDGKYNVSSRFNKKTLILKIKNIAEMKDRIYLFNKDANDLIDTIEKSNDITLANAFIFFDPPYFIQGKNLYLSFFKQAEHTILSEHILSLSEYHWITTYDVVPEILQLYSKSDQKFEYSLRYSANSKIKATEYLFSNSITKIEFPEQMFSKKI